jgi:hypothetical protein
MAQSAINMFSTFGVAVLCIALGIMALAIFFTILSRLKGAGANPDTIAVRGILKKDTWATVHMSGSETFERVRFIGFTNAESFKTHLPYEVNGMVILEDPDKRRFLVRGKAIRMIVIDPAEDTAETTRS